MAVKQIKISEMPIAWDLTGDELVEVVQGGVNKRVSASLLLKPGPDGKSAYDIAVENGFVGTAYDWLMSLKGAQGNPGKAAYLSARDNGFVGTEAEWVESLKGPAGRSAYEVALSSGFVGTQEEWIASLRGPQGPAGNDGINGTNGTNGIDGIDGRSAFEVAQLNGFTGTEAEWLDSLKGASGADGVDSVVVSATAPVSPIEGLRWIDSNTGIDYTWVLDADGGQWVEHGPDVVAKEGLSAYDIAVSNGFIGTTAQWIDSLKGEDGVMGVDGKSAYQAAVDGGFVGTEAEWLVSLKGADGKSAYQIAVDNGFVGTITQWIASLEGADGVSGKSAYEVAVANGFVGTEADWLKSLIGPANTTLPYDLTFSAFEQIAANVVVGATILARKVHFAAGLSGSQAYCDTPPSSSSSRFDLSVNNVVVGSVSFSPGSNLGKWTMAASIDAVVGDIIRLRTAPSADFDNTILGIQLTVVGTAQV